MDVSGVNGNMQNTVWESIQPLQGEGRKGALTGVKLSEEKRLDSWEITHVQSENSASTAKTYQKGPIKVAPEVRAPMLLTL